MFPQPAEAEADARSLITTSAFDAEPVTSLINHHSFFYAELVKGGKREVSNLRWWWNASVSPRVPLDRQGGYKYVLIANFDAH